MVEKGGSQRVWSRSSLWTKTGPLNFNLAFSLTPGSEMTCEVRCQPHSGMGKGGLTGKGGQKGKGDHKTCSDVVQGGRQPVPAPVGLRRRWWELAQKAGAAKLASVAVSWTNPKTKWCQAKKIPDENGEGNTEKHCLCDWCWEGPTFPVMWQKWHCKSITIVWKPVLQSKLNSQMSQKGYKPPA